jgi:hypothetical protein
MRFAREALRLTPDELARLHDCVVEHAAEDERAQVERLLGQLATIRLIPSEELIEFVPVAGTEALARRALQALRASDARETRRLERTRRFGRREVGRPPGAPSPH